ncbi:MAG: YhgE/Pip domain-containing protein [Methanobrevibacter millerae]|uniref:YhgE/Pip domain-containing protein n=1 Tax=Methanobrevibacter millerae TaxID=230361 RepID=A0A8T3VDJ3_9EURY|nr:YhgE/Pip domain-containing protein [Methanobrevibacter millerae]
MRHSRVIEINNNIIEIIKKDFKSAFSNPIVTIVIIGLIIIPSLYALLNIQACWDPYGNTGNVAFAIANSDKGASFDGVDINVGDELVNDLKNNDKFKWTFVSEDELRDGVYKGDYYAGIIIPENLSKNVVSISSDDPQQAKLEYIVNMKENPVAAKLTDTGSTAVYNALNAKIIQIINLAAYGKLGELQSGLASGAGQLASGGSQLASGAGQVSSGASQLSSGAGQLSDGASQLADGAQQLSDGASQVASGTQQASDKVNTYNTEIHQATSYIREHSSSSKVQEITDKIDSKTDTVAGKVQQLNDGAGQVANGSSSLAANSLLLQGGIDELAEGSLSLAAGSVLLSNAATQALFTAAASLASSADSLASITGINETILGDYFYAPVKLDRHELFSVPDYGSQVSPFYLVLSMWVGALITCAMLKPGTSEGTKYSPLEMYMGKAVIFLLLSLLQCSVTIIGAHLLGIYISNEIMFILSCLIVSGVFMIFVYSLVSALGDVGKAVAIVLLVLQISGTGGIYPVEIMAPLFNIMNPILPMTYAITLVREAQLGLIWSNYLPALAVLLAIGFITVFVMLVIKSKADKITHYFEKCLEESGLF